MSPYCLWRVLTLLIHSLLDDIISLMALNISHMPLTSKFIPPLCHLLAGFCIRLLADFLTALNSQNKLLILSVLPKPGPPIDFPFMINGLTFPFCLVPYLIVSKHCSVFKACSHFTSFPPHQSVLHSGPVCGHLSPGLLR